MLSYYCHVTHYTSFDVFKTISGPPPYYSSGLLPVAVHQTPTLSGKKFATQADEPQLFSTLCEFGHHRKIKSK